jgi:hypothetical protein
MIAVFESLIHRLLVHFEGESNCDERIVRMREIGWQKTKVR